MPKPTVAVVVHLVLLALACSRFSTRTIMPALDCMLVPFQFDFDRFPRFDSLFLEDAAVF